MANSPYTCLLCSLYSHAEYSSPVHCGGLGRQKARGKQFKSIYRTC